MSSDPSTPRDPATESADPRFGLRQTLAAARELIAEWAEEGVDEFEALARSAAPSLAGSPAAEAETPAARRPEPRAPSRDAATAPIAARAVAAEEPVAPSSAASTPRTLDQVREELGDCTRCELCRGRKTIVFGSGNPNASLMFIGEGPGQQEDEQGLPFVGPAGELLTNMIEKGLGIPRSEVYICNIVKCRPPSNRDPLPAEVAACQPFLDGQIDAVRPKVIVSLGKPAASLLLGREVAITRLRGSWQSYRGVPLMPTLHPAFILRQYTPENRRMVWQDLKAALARAEE